jgi:hypothetical protein
MKTTSTPVGAARIATAFFLTFIFAFSTVNAQLVVNQIYTGGGTGGATYNTSYVQLVNQSNRPVSLKGFSLQFSRGNGTGWQTIELPEVDLAAGSKYIVAGTRNQTNGEWFFADLDNTSLNLISAGGTVALKTNSTALTSCPTSDATILEYIGWGNASCFVSKPLPDGNNKQAFYRKSSTSSTSLNGSNFSKFQFSAANPEIITLAESTLPVYLHDFAGQATKQGALLRWKASVTGASTFRVERSADGARFHAIATVNSHTNGAEAYSYTDASAGNHTQYYRLRMRDEEGQETFSTVIRLQGAAAQGMAAAYPTVASSQVNVSISSAAQQRISYSVVSLEGRVVMNGVFAANSGAQVFALPVSNLQKGQYLIQLQMGNGQAQTVSFIRS